MKPRLLITNWKLSARIEHVAEVIIAFDRLPEWWGTVFLDAQVIEKGDKSGVGRRALFLTRSRLPLTFLWEAEIIKVNSPCSCQIKTSGDINGKVEWSLKQNGAIADVRIESDISLNRPILGRIAPLMWPTVVEGHRWAMEKGLAGLMGELDQVRARLN